VAEIAFPNSTDLGGLPSLTVLVDSEASDADLRARRQCYRQRMQLPRVFINERQELRRMRPLIAPRRQFLRGLASFVVCAPAVMRASTLMAVSARFCGSSNAKSHWPIEDALALLQHEMERRFTETLFGAENLSAEAENAVLNRGPVVAEVKITALWELRTQFGSRGSSPKSLEDLPAEARADLFSMFGSCAEASYEASVTRFRGFAAHENGPSSI
jgi:hypothetical protein